VLLLFYLARSGATINADVVADIANHKIVEVAGEEVILTLTASGVLGVH
jgi:hypothetical protein